MAGGTLGPAESMGTVKGSYLVDPAISYMLASKIKPFCLSTTAHLSPPCILPFLPSPLSPFPVLSLPFHSVVCG